jgi:hypothetical protein
MNPNIFSANFQKLTDARLPPSPSSHEIAMSLVRRDQRRTWVLAALSLVLWIVGTAGMLLLVIGLNRLVIFIRVADMTPNPPPTQTLNSQASSNKQRPTITSDRDDKMLQGTSLIHHSLPLIGGSVVALLLAAMFTVLLIFSSRRATLNRINISLAQIAEQLKLLMEQQNSKAGGDTNSPTCS